MARQIKLRDILEMRFSGPQMLMHFENDPIIIRKATTIARFMYALHHAYTRHLPLANGINILEIRFQKRNRHVRESVTLNFNASNPADCFGPEFYAALQALLSAQNKAAASAR